MTDEMTTGQQNLTLPVTVGGAVIGGTEGWASAKYLNTGIPMKRYSSFEDIIADTNDEFIKKRIEKGGDNKTNWEIIQNARQTVKDAKATFDNSVNAALGENMAANESIVKYIEQYAAYNKALADAKTKAGDNAITVFVEELAKTQDKAKEYLSDSVMTTEALEKLTSEEQTTYVTQQFKSELDKVSDAKYMESVTAYKNAKSAVIEKLKGLSVNEDKLGDNAFENIFNADKSELAQKIKDTFGLETVDDSITNAISDLCDKKSALAVKDETGAVNDIIAKLKNGELKFPESELEAFSKLEKVEKIQYIKDNMNIIEKVKNAVNEKIEAAAATETAEAKKAVETAEKAVTDSLGDKVPEKLEEKVKDILEAHKTYTNTVAEAKKSITDEVLGKLKSAHTWYTAAAGAAVLGVLGYLLAPKKSEN